ncbi:hypothetical protein L4C33_22250, partial [Vibrio makurazakiensis]|uniref:hypothetical protein n=1 Tax=Vibrio makurazakiensis TaxID=2910250 RepID=UPI003D0EC520
MLKALMLEVKVKALMSKVLMPKTLMSFFSAIVLFLSLVFSSLIQAKIIDSFTTSEKEWMENRQSIEVLYR